jgi:hypothetical protein
MECAAVGGAVADHGHPWQAIRMKLSIDSFRKHDGFVLLT